MGAITRRQFLVGSGTASLGLLAGCGRLPWQAPPTRIPRIGILLPSGAADAASQAVLEPLREGLQERGYVEGQNIVLEYRFADGQPERFPALAAELVGLPVDVIVAHQGDAVVAARQGTSTIPVVMTNTVDPVGLGLVASLARPGGNITGLSSLAAGLAAKRLELLQQTAPAVSRVAMFTNPIAANLRILQESEAAARSLGLEILVLDVRTPTDFPPAFEAAWRAGANALAGYNDPLTVSQQSRILDFAAQSGFAAIYTERSWVAAGGLMSYGTNLAALYQRAAYYVDRILKGAKPADLPVEQPMGFDFVVNLKTARALGISFPPEILLQVTEVIDG